MRVPKVLLNLLVEIADEQRFIELLPLRSIAFKEVGEDFIELDMKGYNRADLLSMRGVGYEVAAILGTKVKFSDDLEKCIWTDGERIKLVNVEVWEPKLSPFYAIAKIEGVEIKESEPWIKEVLEAAGIRPVNNIVDFTNLVMLEYGQPMHAFDLKKVADEKIIVRAGKMGEELITLDGKKRELNHLDIVISDPKKVLGIAGVMGGENSEISNQTTEVLLEAAIFEPTYLRKTASRLALHSEASKRFIHGLTKKRLLQALDRCIKLINGQLTGMTIMDNLNEQERLIEVDLDKVRGLMGVDLDNEKIKEYLNRLYFECRGLSDKKIEVKVPFWRLDIEFLEDVIEEVARMYGYENILAKELVINTPNNNEDKIFQEIDQYKQIVSKSGFKEVYTYSFYSTKVLNSLGFNDANKKMLITVANPISSETKYLRMDLWPNLVEAIDKNIRMGFEDIAIFEVGKRFLAVENSLPREVYTLGMALMNGSDNPLAELYRLFDQVKGEISTDITLDPQVSPKFLHNLFHPNRFVQIKRDGQLIGGMAEVHPRLCFKMGIKKRVAILQIDL